MEILEGRVLLVQEGRFMLETDDGDHHLFILSHKAPLEPQQLPPLQHSQSRVRVSYARVPEVIAYTAHTVERLAGSP